jgi:hypothetical protein
MAGVELGNYKIHCATSAISPPLEAFFDGNFKEWQEYQRKRNFQCDQIVSLIHLGLDKWLFAGVFTVDGVSGERKNKSGKYFLYRTTEIMGLEHLVGRAVVRFNKNFRASYLKGDRYGDELIIAEIRGQRMSVGDFPGYNAVLISNRLLKTIVREEIPSWKSALKSVSGIYIITDTKKGKVYVGSAYGGDGIWQRWAAYANTGHGGNKELKKLLKQKGADHTRNFQYSILEVTDLNANEDHVIGREAHWKNVLMSRKFGYNQN